jgi:hypothetical protein
MPTFEPTQPSGWTTGSSSSSDYGSRAYIEHARQELELQRNMALQQEVEARQRAEIDARAQVFRGEPPTMIGFDTFRNQGRQIPYEPVNNLDPVINNPEKPGRSPF